MCPDNITWISTISKNLYDTQIYGQCLDTWHRLPGTKILLGEGGITLADFHNVNLDQLMQPYQDLCKAQSKRFVRFFKKTLAIWWGLKNCHTRYLIWLDSDVEVLEGIDQFPVMIHAYATMLYPLSPGVQEHIRGPSQDFGVDTGIIVYDLNRLPGSYADEWLGYWTSLRVLELHAPKDTWVLSNLRQNYPCDNLLMQYIDLPSATNYFDYTIWKGKLFHYIGQHQK